MNVPYQFSKCIVCTERELGDPEHVILQVIGGRLKANLLCNKCNHELGSKIISELKTDPSVRLAVENLKGIIPDFTDRFLDKAEYIAKADDEDQIFLTKSGDSLRILAGKGADQSIVLSTDEALGALTKKLERAGLPEDTIRDYQDRFLEAGEDEPVKIPTNETFVKKLLPDPSPNLAQESLKEQFWILLSLEFIALVIGNRVLHKSFDNVRTRILDPCHPFPIKIGYLSAGSQYSPFHIVRLISEENILAVEIRLFRWLVTQVTFDWIRYEGPHPIYLEDLEDKRSYFAPDLLHAEQNRWIEF